MSLNIADNFSYRGRKPLDNRLVFDDILSMSSTADSELYTGLLVFNLENDNLYIYNENNTEDALTGKWRELTMSSGSGSAEITEYKEDVEYKVNELIYLGEKVCRVTSSYTSSNLGNLQDSFDEDVKQGKLVILNTDHVKILNPYAQGNYYEKETLVYLGDYILRVLQDFTSDTTQTSLEDSLDIDISSGNLLILNKEATPGILPYKQGTFFNKDKLVFADGRIGRVLKDYISDNTGATLEESINIDIHNGCLREMAENYKFKLYKTTKDLNKQIDAINQLDISDIIFENGENIGNMQLNEGVYGPLGTLAIISNIDKNTNKIDVKTVNSREMEFMPPAPNTYEFTINLQGSGYSAGEVISTSLPGVNAEIDQVGSSGEILSVISTQETLTNATGTGADVSADIKFYIANRKQWYELPDFSTSPSLTEYTQGTFYSKDTLIFFGDILVRSALDFTSDATQLTIADSLKVDLDNGNIIRMTREDVSVPECLGSAKTDEPNNLPALPIKGNWVLIENCKLTADGQAGIGLYNGTSWDIIPIPQGEFNFPEPTDDGKLYFRSRDSGNTNGQWEVFESIDGNDIELTLKTKSDQTDNTYLPKANELVYDTNRKIIVIGDGSTPLGNLKAFYANTITKQDILDTLGFTPEDSSNRAQANGYAPLDANGKVPSANLPDALTNTYTKTEIDQKDTDTLNSVTSLVNTEAARAKSAEDAIKTDLTTHTSDNTIHVTQTEKDTWDAKVDEDDLDDFTNHINDNSIHVTQADKDRWNGANIAYFVTDKNDLPVPGTYPDPTPEDPSHTTTIEVKIGSIGYVQAFPDGWAAGDPIILEEYVWLGDTEGWQPVDVDQVSLQMKWGNITDRPAATPLTIDNAVTVAHSHNNKLVLDKIGQSAAGNFTYDGVEIGVRVAFMDNENMLPITGTEDTLYVIYEDSRVRNYPSISVWRNGSYQMLGRGIQESAPVVGDMNILQSEYYSVVAGSTYMITVTQNQFFAFMPVEILREIEGLKDQERIVVEVNNPAKFNYKDYLLTVNESSKLTISIKERYTELDTVSDFYHSHVDIDLSEYKDIDNIG